MEPSNLDHEKLSVYTTYVAPSDCSVPATQSAVRLRGIAREAHLNKSSGNVKMVIGGQFFETRQEYPISIMVEFVTNSGTTYRVQSLWR